MHTPHFIAGPDAPPVSYRDFFLAGCEALSQLRDRSLTTPVRVFLPGNLDGGPTDPAPAAPRQPLPQPAPTEAPLEKAAA